MLLYSLDNYLIFFQIDDFNLGALDINLDLRFILKLCSDFAHNSFCSSIHIASQIFDKFIDVSLLNIDSVLLFTICILLEKISRQSIDGGLTKFCRVCLFKTMRVSVRGYDSRLRSINLLNNLAFICLLNSFSFFVLRDGWIYSCQFY